MTPERSDVPKARKFQAPNTKFQSAYPTNLPRLVPSPSSFTHLLLLDVGRYFQRKDVIFLDSMHTLELGPARNHQVIRVPYLLLERLGTLPLPCPRPIDALGGFRMCIMVVWMVQREEKENPVSRAHNSKVFARALSNARLILVIIRSNVASKKDYSIMHHC